MVSRSDQTGPRRPCTAAGMARATRRPHSPREVAVGDARRLGLLGMLATVKDCLTVRR